MGISQTSRTAQIRTIKASDVIVCRNHTREVFAEYLQG